MQGFQTVLSQAKVGAVAASLGEAFLMQSEASGFIISLHRVTSVSKLNSEPLLFYEFIFITNSLSQTNNILGTSKLAFIHLLTAYIFFHNFSARFQAITSLCNAFILLTLVQLHFIGSDRWFSGNAVAYRSGGIGFDF